MRTIFTEAELRAHCHAAGKTCKTEMGCTCRASEASWTPPTDFTELEDHNGGEGFCTLCALSWLVIGFAVASFFMFIGNLVVDIARRNS